MVHMQLAGYDTSVPLNGLLFANMPLLSREHTTDKCRPTSVGRQCWPTNVGRVCQNVGRLLCRPTLLADKNCRPTNPKNTRQLSGKRSAVIGHATYIVNNHGVWLGRRRCLFACMNKIHVFGIRQPCSTEINWTNPHRCLSFSLPFLPREA